MELVSETLGGVGMEDESGVSDRVWVRWGGSDFSVSRSAAMRESGVLREVLSGAGEEVVRLESRLEKSVASGAVWAALRWAEDGGGEARLPTPDLLFAGFRAAEVLEMGGYASALSRALLERLDSEAAWEEEEEGREEEKLVVPSLSVVCLLAVPGRLRSAVLALACEEAVFASWVAPQLATLPLPVVATLLSCPDLPADHSQRLGFAIGWLSHPDRAVKRDHFALSLLLGLVPWHAFRLRDLADVNACLHDHFAATAIPPYVRRAVLQRSKLCLWDWDSGEMDQTSPLPSSTHSISSHTSDSSPHSIRPRARNTLHPSYNS